MHKLDNEFSLYYSKVIELKNGTIEIHGEPKLIAWTYLAKTALVEEYEIYLEEPVDWSIDSQIVIASTGNKLDQNENEIFNIQDISDDRRTLKLESPLKYTHLSETRTVGDENNAINVSIKAEVALLTRNIVINGLIDSYFIPKRTCQEGLVFLKIFLYKISPFFKKYFI